MKKRKLIFKDTGEPFKKFIINKRGKQEQVFVWDEKGYPLHYRVDKRNFIEKNWLNLLLGLLGIIIGSISLFLYFL